MSQWSSYEDELQMLGFEKIKFQVVNINDLRNFVLSHFNSDWQPKMKESCHAVTLTGRHALGFLELKNALQAGEKIYPSQIIDYLIEKNYIKSGDFLILNYKH